MPGQQLVIATGGRGGRGNARFANSRDQAPRIAERGEPGQERLLKLELKLIADVGIVGVPNAGKSSFLAAITKATPKIGDYPFTTIEPNLGVVEMDLDNSFVVADIPGLLEGAHAGVGLGDSFLRHIQRTRIIIHLLDGLSRIQLPIFLKPIMKWHYLIRNYRKSTKLLQLIKLISLRSSKNGRISKKNWLDWAILPLQYLLSQETIWMCFYKDHGTA